MTTQLTEAERNFIGWCVRKLDDYICEFVEDTMQDEQSELTIPEDEVEYEEYSERIFSEVYAGLVGLTSEQLSAAVEAKQHEA